MTKLKKNRVKNGSENVYLCFFGIKILYHKKAQYFFLNDFIPLNYIFLAQKNYKISFITDKVMVT